MLREFPEFFALLLTANYRDIMLREFLEFFALLLTANYRDIMLRQIEFTVITQLVWRKSIASLHRLTQDVQLQCPNLRRTAGDPTWVNTKNSNKQKYLQSVNVKIA